VEPRGAEHLLHARSTWKSEICQLLSAICSTDPIPENSWWLRRSIAPRPHPGASQRPQEPMTGSRPFPETIGQRCAATGASTARAPRNAWEPETGSRNGSQSPAPMVRAIRRYSLGVTPLSRRNRRLKLARLLNPARSAISAMPSSSSSNRRQA